MKIRLFHDIVTLILMVLGVLSVIGGTFSVSGSIWMDFWVNTFMICVGLGIISLIGYGLRLIAALVDAFDKGEDTIDIRIENGLYDDWD